MRRELQIQEDDCESAAIASILDLPSGVVPNFHRTLNPPLFLPDHVGDSPANRRNEWLRQRGWFLAHMWTHAPRGWSIGAIDSTRHPGTEHAVVCFDGVPVWDPHPDQDGYGKPVKSYDVLISIVPRNPLTTGGGS